MSTHSLVAPVSIEGKHVRLEPLRPEHATLLWEIAKDHLDDLFRWIPYRLQTLNDFQALNRHILEEQERGVSVPFVTVERGSNAIVGTTRYMNMDLANRKVEIGSTWIAPKWQRTVINTEAKYLMLRHAFETLGCMRVELKTNALNLKSRAAMLRIGAKEEGTLRKHMLTERGTVRDSVYFSVIDDEWAAVKARLEGMMQRA